MDQTTVYIAASWKHAHAVELLTSTLRETGYEVRSFVEENYGEGYGAQKPIDFEKWVNSESAQRSFKFDSESAMTSDFVIYIGPSGKDAAAECGMAFAKNVPIYGLFAKGEDFGLMRKMFKSWFERYNDLLLYIYEHHPVLIEA